MEREGQLLERVQAIVPRLAAEAEESEKRRRPTDRAIALMSEAGVFRALLPERYGGDSLDLEDFAAVGMALGEADISLAWVATFLMEHCWLLTHFPEPFQASLFSGGGDVLAPAALAGEATVQPVDGGFILDGRWRWASGSSHASWVLVGAGAEGRPRFFALPREEVSIDDVWHTSGMRATSSNDILIDSVFVAEERSVDLLALSCGQGEGARIHGSAIWRTPMFPVLVTAATTPIVGQARRVVRRFAEETVERVRMGTGTAVKTQPRVQVRVAEVEQSAHEAEQQVRWVARDVARVRGDATLLDRARWALALARAAHRARAVIQQVADGSGGTAQFDEDPLQRALRDANTALTHVVFDLDARHEMYGRVRLGLDPGSFLL
jgi:alkylation response protein AidB-like acyl-CoA dehydrogenase